MGTFGNQNRYVESNVIDKSSPISPQTCLIGDSTEPVVRLFIRIVTSDSRVVFTPHPHPPSSITPIIPLMLAEYCGRLPSKAAEQLITQRPAGGTPQSSPADMTAAAALRVCLVLWLQLRCVALPVPPPGRGAPPGGSETSDKLDALLHLKDLPRGPAVAPHKKAPQFMLDLFNAVSASDGSPRSQKDILEGNIVRSFEDRGESP